ncbi:pentapeptide repeat-containing protein [Streptosporangium sp. NBC_01639]|uniref:pentapeptide repeat-containing protein n=1 Tax=unclassified Streptosporangium TaxID=2632669 RepID=UPI002DD82C86|nr:pentapeptide repeat-containing protein [Streptosporangium sp. NBC_01756]WSC84252.1 pentapeptide repeat-containing protein [Streptosporangium sp. NBC_01756]WTD57131.1 pentapeptide repeat-containing protein [Streptosporangium sp. NBC_01639]
MPSHISPARSRRLKEPLSPKLAASLVTVELVDDDLEEDGAYSSTEFRGVDLTSRNADGVEFDGCRFVDTRFSGTAMRRGGFSNVELERCDLSGMTAGMASMHRTRVSASRLTGMTWTECGFKDVTFDGCRADLTAFRFSTFKNTVFRDCAMPEVTFQNADLRGVRFERCNLTGAQFSGAQLEGARFAECVLLGIGGVTSLRGATIKSQDAQGLVYSLAGAMGITIED